MSEEKKEMKTNIMKQLLCFCCQSNKNIPNNNASLIDEKLRKIDKIFPDTTYKCLVRTSGELITQSIGALEASEELHIVIASLQKAAVQFASTLNQLECPVIHIKGNTHIFSCYEINKEILLAIYNPISSDHIKTDNFYTEDDLIQPIIEELQGTLSDSLSQ